MAPITFKPKQATKRLLAELSERAQEILIRRYGLGFDAKKMTLESIGQKYKITRERVRQIENYALSAIRKSDAFGNEQETFDELESLITTLGGLISEDEFLDYISEEKSIQNNIHFLLVLGNAFKRAKEDSEFKHRWFVDDELVKRIHASLQTLYRNLTDDDLIIESELIELFLKEIKDLNQKYKNEEIVRRWFNVSKKLGINPLGEWGRADSSNVRVKGMRDYAYLTIKRHGSPMHFTEVAKAISNIFHRNAHIATCHNELIKDARFVLVGRGLYALSEWGYTTGVVKDVIMDILKVNGSLTRDEIVDKVRNERYVKDNTIIVNLQDSTCFRRNKSGKYTLV
ncbi:hypothetical protein IID27_00490 [Patescibacteria group bacterium]|nr:hypothetical protein [Patescibacteria group bacterium]